MLYGDLHIHSCFSNGYHRNLPPWVSSTPEEILIQAKKVGLKVVGIADHDSLEGFYQAEKISKKYDIIVISGCEVTTRDGHLLAYGIKKEIPKKLSAQETIKMIHDQGGLAIAAHPFQRRWDRFGFIGLRGLVEKLSLDGLEVVNATSSSQADLLAFQALKKDSRLRATGGSDSHVLDFIGFGRTIFEDNVKTAEDVFVAIKQGRTQAEIVERVAFLEKCLASFRDQFKFLAKNLV